MLTVLVPEPLAVAIFGSPLPPLTVQTVTALGALEPVLKLTAALKVPVPVPVSTLTFAVPAFAVTRSRLPSPSKSPAAMPEVLLPPVNVNAVDCTANVPA